MVHNTLDAKGLQVFFFFPKTMLFLAMLLVCGRCHLHLRMDVYMCWITSLIWWLLKSLTTIFKLAGYFSAECTRSLEEHTKKILEIDLRDLLCPFIFVHKCTGVIQSTSVFHLNTTALDQVESTATTLLFLLLHFMFFKFSFHFSLIVHISFFYYYFSLLFTLIVQKYSKFSPAVLGHHTPTQADQMAWQARACLTANSELDPTVSSKNGHCLVPYG